MGCCVGAAVAIAPVHLPGAGDRLVPVKDVLVESVLPVSHVATTSLWTLVTRPWVRSSVGHLLNVQHHESSRTLDHPVMSFAMTRTTVEGAKCFVTVFTLKVPSRVSFFVSLERLLVVKALLAEVALKLPVVNH